MSHEKTNNFDIVLQLIVEEENMNIRNVVDNTYFLQGENTKILVISNKNKMQLETAIFNYSWKMIINKT